MAGIFWSFFGEDEEDSANMVSENIESCSMGDRGVGSKRDEPLESSLVLVVVAVDMVVTVLVGEAWELYALAFEGGGAETGFRWISADARVSVREEVSMGRSEVSRPSRGLLVSPPIVPALFSYC